MEGTESAAAVGAEEEEEVMDGAVAKKISNTEDRSDRCGWSK